MWYFVLILLTTRGNYVITQTQYSFESRKACVETRKQLAKVLTVDQAIMTECVGEEN